MSSWDARTLAVWGKSGPPMVPLVIHLEDTAVVSEYLYDHFLAPHTKSFLTNDTIPESDLKNLIGFLCATHDIGKCTPDFQIKDRNLAENLHQYGMRPKENLGQIFKERAHHSTTGQYIMERYLEGKGVMPAWADVVGSHHGKAQFKSILYGAGRKRAYSHYTSDLLMTGPWEEVRQGVLDHFWEKFDMDTNSLVRIAPTLPMLMTITGFLVLCDWMASDEHHFNGADLDDPQRTERALARIQLPKMWSPSTIPAYKDRFGFEPYTSQQEIADFVAQQPSPGMYILESSMGTGKTETAFVCAEILAGMHGANGLVFALPTRASANAIFNRFIDWMDHLPEEEMALNAPIHLAHGRARLNEKFLEVTGAVKNNISIDEPDHARTLPRFFQNSKTSPSAPMLVTTVDHVFASGLDAKHQMLRHIALIGKVVVVDEVHAYDTHMNVFFDAALRWFGQYKMPIILLSATLPPSRRQELVKAYNGMDDASVAEADGYPLLTYASCEGDVIMRSFDAPKAGVPYTVTHLPDDDDDLIAEVKKTTDRGGNVLVIRNTVNRAIGTFTSLQEHFEQEKLTLLHSRFLAADRERIEKGLVEKFGSRVVDRDTGCVAVSTQVAEQSLDIDFDTLITDIAPIDLILQRMGRVYRNIDAERHVDHAQLVIIDLNLANNSLPYDQWSMSQASELLKDRTVVTTPDDVPSLVRQGYEEDMFPEYSAELRQTQDSKKRSALGYAIASPDSDRMLDMFLNSAEENSVRDIDDTSEVIFLVQNDQGELTIPPWFPEELKPGCPVSARPSRSEMKAISAAMMSLRNSMLRKKKAVSTDIPGWDAIPALAYHKVIVLKESGAQWAGQGFDYDLKKGLY